MSKLDIDELKKLKRGDRVRIVLEDDVDEGFLEGLAGRLRFATLHDLIDLNGDACVVVSIEKIEPPLAPGDRVRDGDGDEGTVLAIQDGLAWVLFDTLYDDWPVTLRCDSLTRIPKETA
jgi:hypothetical protein